MIILRPSYYFFAMFAVVSKTNVKHILVMKGEENQINEVLINCILRKKATCRQTHCMLDITLSY